MTFILYDAMKYSGKPDLAPQGIAPTKIFYHSDLWAGATETDSPYKTAIEACAGGAISAGVTSAIPLQLDIEKWVLDIRASQMDSVTSGVGKMTQAIAWFKSAAPFLNVGIYAYAPLRDYWAPVAGPQAAIDSWHAANDLVQPMADAVDTLYPSLYTFYDDQPGWVTYAEANIAEAQRLAHGKRVLPFIWPQYHDSAPPELRGTFLPADYWTLQLQTIKGAGCQGAVIWGHSGYAWDDAREWWTATLAFLATL